MVLSVLIFFVFCKSVHKARVDMGKSSKSHNDEEITDKEDKWDRLVSQVERIANPLASKKLTKRLYKIIKKAEKVKQLRRGVREVQKFIRKGEKGIVLLAGNTSPIEVICHLPIVCEDLNMPYCYVPSKEDLGAACNSKRPTCVMLIKTHGDYEEAYDELWKEVQDLPLPI